MLRTGVTNGPRFQKFPLRKNLGLTKFLELHCLIRSCMVIHFYKFREFYGVVIGMFDPFAGQL